MQRPERMLPIPSKDSRRRKPFYISPSLDVKSILHKHTHKVCMVLLCTEFSTNATLQITNFPQMQIARRLHFVGNFPESCSKFQKILSWMVMLFVVFVSTHLSIQFLVILQICRSVFVYPLFLYVNDKDEKKDQQYSRGYCLTFLKSNLIHYQQV